MMGATLASGVLELIDNRLEYEVLVLSLLSLSLGTQGAVSGNQVTNSSSEEDLSCMNCRWLEMGHMSSFTGRCDWCGGVPPRLRWMYPSSSTRGQLRAGTRSRGRRRPPRQGETRSSSADRSGTGAGSSTVPVIRRQHRYRTTHRYGKIFHTQGPEW